MYKQIEKLLYNFQIENMGCNQTSPAAVERVAVAQIPCTVEDVARYINDVRADPSKYADLLEK